MEQYRAVINRFILFFCFLILTTVTQAQSPTPFPEGTKRILFLGNSITYAGAYVTDVESYFVTHYPAQSYEFINVGLPSETVSGLSEPNHADGRFPRPDLHERLARVLDQTKPDVVFACYGMNDGIYLPLDESRFRPYRDGQKWLHAELEKVGAKRIIFLTPPVHDDKNVGTQGYNLTLDTYSEWLLAQRDSLKWEVVDIHFPMTQYLEEKRKIDPSFKLANDGVHPGDEGHWLMAKAILNYLGQNVANAPDVKSTLTVNPRGEEIRNLIAQRQSIMKDAWLRSTGHKRPEMRQGIPMAEARKQYDELETKIRTAVNGK
ncbi:SGNH/GDSL hydrolase family protein [Spirosoma litoris]